MMMRDEGWIRFDRKMIEILDENALQSCLEA
jgi:hypothetical protein